jgi:hypothetical protein
MLDRSHPGDGVIELKIKLARDVDQSTLAVTTGHQSDTDRRLMASRGGFIYGSRR